MSKWPKKIKFRNRVLAKIYRPCRGRASYRVTWYAAGKRQMKSFATYAGQDGAREYAEAKVKELATNSQAAILTPAQATDALASIERLNTHYRDTGRKITLLAAVSEYCEAAAKVHGRGLTVPEAVEGFSRTVATVIRKDLLAAVEDFIKTEEPRTRSDNGQRAQLSKKYHYNRAIQLRRFAGVFADYAVCDLGRHDLDVFFGSKLISGFSSKSRKSFIVPAATLYRFPIIAPRGSRPMPKDLAQLPCLSEATSNSSSILRARKLVPTRHGNITACVTHSFPTGWQSSKTFASRQLA